MAISRGESIALWTAGILMFVVFMGCLGWRLFSITFKTMIVRMTGRGRKRRLNPTEKRVNKILSNESAREILKAHALTAINSQANKRRAGYSSQLSLDSTGTVPDLTDRVVRVSFAPAGEAGTSSSTGAVVLPVPGVSRDSDGDNNTETLDQISVSALSLGGSSTVSRPPAYDTLSTHSRVSASDPPPEYGDATETV